MARTPEKTKDAQEAPARDLTVITTHVNADFDALASMMAAAKLYPEALLVFPGSQERNLRNFYVESVCYLFNFEKVKNVDFSRVGRLVLVDTRQVDRIGALSELALDPEVEIHAYDHHPDSDTDASTSLEVVEEVGATVTVLSRLLRERGVELTEDEATILTLGIYEDTGSFSFPSTTPADFEAAGWLLSHGAKLNLVSQLVTRELTAEEVGLLNDLIRSAEGLIVNGVEVMISEVSRERYLPDFAVLVHKFMDMENLDTLFALARMEGRVYLVARSRLPQVDAGAIATALGGGGHPTAASATLRDMTLVEARARLESVLQTHINPSRTAGDLMTSPVVTVGPDTTLGQAHDVLNRYGLNVLPVLDDGRVLGFIGRQTVEKAMTHRLATLPVSEYMERSFTPLAVDSSLALVEEAVVGQRQRLVPVMDGERLAGIITRTDLLNVLLEHPPMAEPDREDFEEGEGGGGKRVGGLMRERLPREVVAVLEELGAIADEMGFSVYLVGGSVRDIFLRRDNLDLDVVVEGDGTEFAKRVARGRGDVRVRTHTKFKTAKLIFGHGLVIDVATARLEYYQAPASLPIVELSSLKLDLYRRDFTINTLAVALNQKSFGRLIDFFDGMRDIKDKAIRVLHNLSFVEDPTRVLRAVRFEQRFGFKIGKFTEGLIKNAVKIEAFSRLSPTRLFGEFRQMMEEERARDCILRLDELKLLTQFHPHLRLEAKALELLEEVEEALAWYRLSFLDRPLRQWVVYFLALADQLRRPQAEQLMDRLGMTGKLKGEINQNGSAALAALNQLQRSQHRPSQVHALLTPLGPEYLLFIMAKATREWAKRAVSNYLTRDSRARQLICGDDLIEMGFVPGPLFRRILDRVLDARLDGEVESKEDERRLVLQEFGQMRARAS